MSSVSLLTNTIMTLGHTPRGVAASIRARTSTLVINQLLLGWGEHPRMRAVPASTEDSVEPDEGRTTTVDGKLMYFFH
jgi:hypothetical protein